MTGIYSSGSSVEHESQTCSYLSNSLEQLLLENSTKVQFQMNRQGKGMGAFATTDIAADELIFTVPRKRILSSNVCVMRDETVKDLSKNMDITAETLFFCFIALHLRQHQTVISEAESNSTILEFELELKLDEEYLASLPRNIPQLLPNELLGTNVGAQLLMDMEELKCQHEIVLRHMSQKSFPSTCGDVDDVQITLQELINAKALYNSRRYPVRFALDTDIVHGDNNSNEEAALSITDNKIDKNNNDKKRKRLNSDTASTTSTGSSSRRVYDPSQGALVPLLDVLNHDSKHDYLRFATTNTHLQVFSRIGIKKNQEIFSNYGCTSNDQFLLQFGFCYSDNDTNDDNDGDDDDNKDGDKDNDHDKDDCEPNEFDVFAVKLGGQRYELSLFTEIPEQIISDGGKGLRAHLKSKYKLLPSKLPESHNSEVRNYMARQRKLLRGLIKQLG